MPPDRDQRERERRLEAELRRQAEEYGRLSPDEERRQVDLLPSADAARSLVEHNLDLVVEQAEAHRDQGLVFSDLYQEGTVGLLDAVAAYPTMTGAGANRPGFREFASLHIGLQIDSLLQAEAEARKEAEDDVRDVRTLDMAQAMFRSQNRRDATPAEMQATLGWDEGRLERIERMLAVSREQNDAATLSVLEDADGGELGVDFWEDQPDPRRRPEGHGPDADE